MSRNFLLVPLVVAALSAACSHDWEAFEVMAGDAGPSLDSSKPDSDSLDSSSDVSKEAAKDVVQNDVDKDVVKDISTDSPADTTEDVAEDTRQDVLVDVVSDVPQDGVDDQTPDVDAAPPSGCGVLIPLYIYPSPGQKDWARVEGAAKAHPTVPIVAIVNPNNGPGRNVDSNYTSAIASLHNAGVTLIGYVRTRYAKRDASLVRADIDRYRTLYPTVDGIFFDEVSNKATHLQYYQTVASYASDKQGFSPVIANPGTDVPPSFVGSMDNFVIYEDDGVPSLSFLGGWHSSAGAKNFSFLAENVPTLDSNYLSAASKRVAYLYLTDDTGANPWDTLPPYFEKMVQQLDR